MRILLTILAVAVCAMAQQQQQQHQNISQPLTLVEGPMDQEVRSNTEVILQCQFSGNAKECMWLKDSEITIVRDPYQFKGDPEMGDCSLRIASVALIRDGGNWQCQYPRLGNSPAIISKSVKLTVLVPPEDPTIYHEGAVKERGSTLTLSQVGESGTLTCSSRKGNPEATLFWMIEGRRLPPTPENVTSEETVSGEQLFTAESHLDLHVSQDLQGKQIKCVAEHPAYHGELHESYINIEVHHNTTQVNLFADMPHGDRNIEIEADQQVTLYCLADGVPKPSYRWEFQRKGKGEWETWSSQQNLTVAAMAGKFTCSAGNDYNVEHVRAPEEITVETKVHTDKNGVTALQASMTTLVVSIVTRFAFITKC